MVAPIIVPEMQFLDANGTPLAGASITTYAMDTSVPKATWLDPQQSALQTNPAILDAAGRVRLYGDGDYRLVLKDILGNLIWDTPATTIVSAAMAPVVSAPTIPDALNLLGVNALISAEATARSNADSAEQSARIAADNAEASTRAAYDAAIQTNLDNENAARIAADNNLQAQITALPPAIANAVTMQTGSGTSASSAPGAISVTFGSAYATHTQDFNINGGTINPAAFFSLYQPVVITPIGSVTNSGATGYMCMIRCGDRQPIAICQCRVHLVCDRALSAWQIGTQCGIPVWSAARELTARLPPPGVASSWRCMPAQAMHQAPRWTGCRANWTPRLRHGLQRTRRCRATSRRRQPRAPLAMPLRRLPGPLAMRRSMRRR